MSASCMVHTFLNAACSDCNGALTWQTVILGNIFLMRVRVIRRFILLDARDMLPTWDQTKNDWGHTSIGASGWMAHVR